MFSQFAADELSLRQAGTTACTDDGDRANSTATTMRPAIGCIPTEFPRQLCRIRRWGASSRVLGSQTRLGKSQPPPSTYFYAATALQPSLLYVLTCHNLITATILCPNGPNGPSRAESSIERKARRRYALIFAAAPTDRRDSASVAAPSFHWRRKETMRASKH